MRNYVTPFVLFTGVLIGTLTSSIIAVAWTGPTQTPTGGNVSAPINVGTTDQVKNAGLGVNSLTVNVLISRVLTPT